MPSEQKSDTVSEESKEKLQSIPKGFTKEQLQILQEGFTSVDSHITEQRLRDRAKTAKGLTWYVSFPLLFSLFLSANPLV